MQSEYSTELRAKIVELIDKQNDTYYQIELIYEKHRRWYIDRTFKEFCDLHSKLHNKIPNMPILPEKYFFRLSFKELQKRKIELEKYLNALCFKKDVLADPNFRKFVEFKDHPNQEDLTKFLTEIDDIPMEVSQMIYLPYCGVLMLGLGETGVVAKIDTIIGKFTTPTTQNTLFRGSIVFYGEEPIGTLKFSKLWHKAADSSVLCMYWDEDLTLLAAGTESGNITVLRIASEHEYEIYDEFCSVDAHTAAVTGVALVKSTGVLVSVSLDKNLYLTKLSENEAETTAASTKKYHNHPLVKMLYDSRRERIFVSDSTGTLYIYATDMPIVLLGIVDFPRQNYVTSFFYDPTPGYLFSGSREGVIAIYEIEKPGREKYTQIIGSIQTIKNVTDMCYISSSRQLLVSNDLGNVLFVNSQNAASFYTLDAHTAHVTAISYHPDLRMLVTASKDKTVKFWRYPFEVDKDADVSTYGGKSLRSSNIVKKSRGIYAPGYDYSGEKNEDSPSNSTTQHRDSGQQNNQSNSKSAYNDYLKRYDYFRDDQHQEEEEEEQKQKEEPYLSTKSRQKNLSIVDDSVITQREEDISHKQFELDYSKRSDPLTNKKSTMNKNVENDDDDEIGIPKNPFATNQLPIPFPTKQDNGESDLKGWEAGEDKEEKELSKRSQRPLVSHFRDFPNTALNEESDQYPTKRKRNDEDEEQNEIGGWDKPNNEPKKNYGSDKGSLVKNDPGAKPKTQNLPVLFGESKLPEPKKDTRKREADDEIAGWATYL